MRRIAGDVVTRGEDSSTQLGFTVVEMLVSLILFTITLWLGSSVFRVTNLERPRNGLRRSSRWT